MSSVHDMMHSSGGAILPRYPPMEAPSSGLLSLNIFYRRKKASMCMSNCRNIEVAILYPRAPPSSCLPTLISVSDFQNTSLRLQESSPETHEDVVMVTADQEPGSRPGPVDLSLTTSISNTSRAPPPSFRFLDLPLELRLKIYTYLLPARAHTIATQIPHNGYYYNTASLPSHSASSFYPFGRCPTHNLTTYKVLTDNFRSGFPSPSIYPEILRVSKQLLAEAEPVLYGAKDALWDFGVHAEALLAFWGDRSQVARACVRNLRIAKEIPALLASDSNSNSGVDARWLTLCAFIKNELVGLGELDLTIWSGSGSVASFPSNGSGGKDEEERWREWEWTRELLDIDALRCARLTWWGFSSVEVGGMPAVGFDSWMAGRIMADRLARDRMIEQGLVVEGSLVVSRKAA